jgi:hypothetical protein
MPSIANLFCMRLGLFLIVASMMPLLVGCAEGSFARAVGLAETPEAVNARQRELAALDDAKCRSYGATPGTDMYVQCRMALDQQRQQRASDLARGLLSHH